MNSVSVCVKYFELFWTVLVNERKQITITDMNIDANCNMQWTWVSSALNYYSRETSQKARFRLFCYSGPTRFDWIHYHKLHSYNNIFINKIIQIKSIVFYFDGYFGKSTNFKKIKFVLFHQISREKCIKTESFW